MDRVAGKLGLEAVRRELPQLQAKMLRIHGAPSLLRLKRGATRADAAKSFLTSIGARPSKGQALGAIVSDYIRWHIEVDDHALEQEHLSIESLLAVIAVQNGEYEGALLATLGALESWAERTQVNAWRADAMLEMVLDGVLIAPSSAREECESSFRRVRSLTWQKSLGG